MQPANPRIYSTHLPYSLVLDGGKSFRDPKDAMISAYHFMNSFIALNGRVALSMFAHAALQQMEKQLGDLLMWWEHRNNKDLLLIVFDDLKEDHAGTMCRIAMYMGVDLDDDAVTRVVHTTSHAEMSGQASKFDTRKVAMILTKNFGDEPPAEEEFVGRVRKDGGKSGEGK